MNDAKLKTLLKTFYFPKLSSSKNLKEAVLRQLETQKQIENTVFSTLPLRTISLWGVALCTFLGIFFILKALPNEYLKRLDFLINFPVEYSFLVLSALFAVFVSDQFFIKKRNVL